MDEMESQTHFLKALSAAIMIIKEVKKIKNNAD
jgi:hypothetical protein